LNKKVLIISPYFPPSNAADMQRIRMSLPYFREFGWDAEVVTVGSAYSEMLKDDLLLQSIPAWIKIHTVKALSKKWTSKLGLGSLALRSIISYRKKVNQLLKETKFDLIYFSTTQFPVSILGASWKRRFGVPYVIDMQDPWHSDYYKDKPKDQQPPKYWFSYRLNKYLEPIAIKHVDGLISVSENYINDLKKRYPVIKDIPSATITFGAFEPDLKIASDNAHLFKPLLDKSFTNIVYIGRGGMDMHMAVSVLFKALKDGLDKEPNVFNKLRIHFIGTSYAPNGQGAPTILPLAKQFGIENNVIEITDRISYYHTLATLQQADALFIPGSDDPKYTASKIYPYLLTRKPLIAIFNKQSNAVKALNECAKNVVVLTFDDEGSSPTDILYKTLANWGNNVFSPIHLSENFKKYSAKELTGKQVELFEDAIEHVKCGSGNV
jgi:Glycosyltransferase Family 4